jgi:DNA mismatch repair ATPase MutS
LGTLLKSTTKLGKRLSKEENPIQEIGKDMTESLHSVKKLKKLISNFSGLNSSGDDLSYIIYESLNYVFLLEVNLYLWSIKTIRSNRSDIQRLFEMTGYLDSMVSIASFKESLPVLCKPSFTNKEKTLSYTSIYHPLLEDPIPNDLHIHNKSILITGSNMAGKSTFLKTIGINQILAQTFYFCCASEATLSFSRLITSMRREDDITEGKSYYLTEVERIKELLNHSDTSVPNLFLIDEIFRGTNTVERVAASREVLMYLNNKKDIVIASTHDLELLDLLDGGFEFYHFREFVHDDSLDFDYKIREGATSTRNAIAILRLTGYPESLVENAINLSHELDKKK